MWQSGNRVDGVRVIVELHEKVVEVRMVKVMAVVLVSEEDDLLVCSVKWNNF